MSIEASGNTVLSSTDPLRIVVLLSGRGSNFIAIHKAIGAQAINAEIVAVLSNKADAAGLEYARKVGIPAHVIEHRAFPDRESFDREMIGVIDEYEPGLVVLAGFMRILTGDFVRHYAGRLINIHPSLLPKFPGLDTHQRAIDAGEPEHGATVHFVEEEVDSGEIIIQARVPVLESDTAENLARRVLEQEHRIYPAAVRWIAEGKKKPKPTLP